MKFIQKQKDSLSKLLYDFARLTFAAAILGQLIAEEKFKLWVLIVGIIAIIVFTLIGLIIEGGEKQ